MEHVLIISGSRGAADALSGFLKETLRCTPKVVESAYQAKMALEKDASWDLAVINAPLLDESGVELAKYVTQKTAASCILLIRQETVEQLADFPERYQVILLGKPVGKPFLYQVLQAVDVTLRRMLRLYEENRHLEGKIKDIQTIDRAKFMMMQYQGMTESQAHAYLERYAMNQRKRKPIAALEIIDKINEQYL